MKKIIDGIEYKVWKLPHPLLIHWILNPGLVINELILGQRIPKQTLVISGGLPDPESSLIECKVCESLHPGTLWSGKAMFGHYNGIFCPTCEAKIPQLLNIFSIIILAITVPLWKPVQMIYGERVKQRSLAKLRDAKNAAAIEGVIRNSFVKMGMNFGLLMGVFYIVIFSMENGPSLGTIVKGVVAGAAAGVLFGIGMKLFASAFNKGKKPS